MKYLFLFGCFILSSSFVMASRDSKGQQRRLHLIEKLAQEKRNQNPQDGMNYIQKKADEGAAQAVAAFQARAQEIHGLYQRRGNFKSDVKVQNEETALFQRLVLSRTKELDAGRKSGS